MVAYVELPDIRQIKREINRRRSKEDRVTNYFDLEAEEDNDAASYSSNDEFHDHGESVDSDESYNASSAEDDSDYKEQVKTQRKQDKQTNAEDSEGYVH